MQMELTDEECLILKEEIGRRLNELNFEILHTDHLDFRNMLKHRRDVLAKIATILPAELGS